MPDRFDGTMTGRFCPRCCAPILTDGRVTWCPGLGCLVVEPEDPALVLVERKTALIRVHRTPRGFWRPSIKTEPVLYGIPLGVFHTSAEAVKAAKAQCQTAGYAPFMMPEESDV